MALIKCPECGRTVSDMAAACPDCGYPIAKNNPSGSVSIKIQIGGILKFKVVDEAGNVLGSGRTGDVVTFHVNSPTNVRITGGGQKCPYQLVKAGKRYTVGLAGISGFSLRFNKVDVIDS